MVDNLELLRLYSEDRSEAAFTEFVGRHLNVVYFTALRVADGMVDAAVGDQVKEQFNNDQAAFLASLDAQGVTLAQYRQSVDENIEYNYMIHQQRILGAAKPSQTKVSTP